MARPYKLRLIEGYPHTCDECPLKGDVPPEELAPGDKWNHICIARMVKMSGRGCKQPNARNRCGRRWYESFYYSRHKDGQGRPYFEVVESVRKRYNINIQQKLF